MTHVLLGSTADGRDVAGALVGLLGWGLLANASGAASEDGGLVVEATVLGGKAITRSTLTGPTGIVTVGLGAVAAEPAGATGTIESVQPAPEPATPPRFQSSSGSPRPGRRHRSRKLGSWSSAAAASGSPEGFAIVDELAGILGGVTGATRASVDAGWIAYARQIGQTGKIVKPALYLGLGVSGAMQHRVGMQGAETIIAVNRDPDAPIAEIADLFVVGDLFQVGPALAAELRARRGT